MLYSMKIRPM